MRQRQRLLDSGRTGRNRYLGVVPYLNVPQCIRQLGSLPHGDCRWERDKGQVSVSEERTIKYQPHLENVTKPAIVLYFLQI